MIKTFTLINLLLYATFCLGQNNVLNEKLKKQEIKSLTTLGELWGFLKYYHPKVAKGQLDWDSVLITKIPLYKKANGKQAISSLTESWLKELGTFDSCKVCYENVPDSLAYNLDFTWMNENTFTSETISKLKYVKANRNIGLNYYVEYDKTKKLLVNIIHEKSYENPAFLFPAAEFRLLLLFRYWNIVHYFSPYKYLNGKDWKYILENKISSFYGAKDTLTYLLEYIRLIAGLNDGHSVVSGFVMDKYFGKSYPVPFFCMLINNKFVVSSIRSNSAAEKIRIRKGDIICEVNGEDVIKRYKKLSPYVLASNEDNKAMYFASTSLFRGTDSTFIIKKIRAGIKIQDTIQLSQNNIVETTSDKAWNLTNDSIGYVNMGQLKKSEADSMMSVMESTKGIIFDLRNYPLDTWPIIAAYLCKTSFVMSVLSYPDLNYPGVFLNFRKIYGRNNAHPYSGKVILLVDESSVSHAEYSAMGLQAATQTITIGNTTAGKDGDLTYFTLPGGLLTRFTGWGISYPDGTVTQRKGIKIDINVRPTIKGLQEGRDEILEAALNYIRRPN